MIRLGISDGKCELFYRESEFQRMPYCLVGGSIEATMNKLGKIMPLYFKGG